MMFRPARLVPGVLALLATLANAQDTADNVNLFQTYFQDATIAKSINGEGFFQYGTYNNFSIIDLAAQSAFPVSPRFQVGGAWAFESVSPDQGDSQNGVTDIAVSGRYQVVQGKTPVAIGALFTLPVGSEEIGDGNFNFGFFGSLRHDVESSPIVLAGTFGLDFVESAGLGGNSDRNTSVLIAGSVIYPMRSGLGLVFEINMRPDDDYALLSGGLDYPLRGGGRVRGALGLGLDDAAPDFAFRLGYALGF
ncbi:MAG: hypothetical protein ACREOO_30955 [bacterium]